MSDPRHPLRSPAWLAAFCVVPAVLLAAGGTSYAQGWSMMGWQYRRPVVIDKFTATRLDGLEVGVVTMPTGGLTKPDGSDIRVVAGLDREVPHRVLMVGPGDQVRIAFAVFSTVTSYNVYFGDPKAPAPTKELEIKRGVLLETWEYSGGAVSTLPQVRKAFDRANKLLGREFLDTVFLGYNPFSAEHRIASRFTGWLVAPRAGQYNFAASSRNACFLLVDDKLVVDFGGWHGPVGDIRKRGTIDLTAGLHKLTVYHVSSQGDPQVVAAWQAPGDKRIWVIPGEAFAPIHRARPEAMKKYGAELTADFIPEHANEAFLMDHYLQRYKFKADWSGQGGTRLQWNWDFGDGQTATGVLAEHVYLLPGLYAVTLTGTQAGRPPLTRTNRIFVSRPWERVTNADVDTVRYHANIVAGYDFRTLSPEATAWAIHLFQQTQKPAAILRAGEAFVNSKEAPGDSIRVVVPAYADELIATGKAVRAIGALDKASGMTKDPAVAAEMLAKAGQTYLLDPTKADQALAVFTTVIRKYSAISRTPAIREARMGIGDAWRAKGDYKKAQEAYKEAHTGPEAVGTTGPIVKGDYARHVEDYVRKGDLESAEDYLKRWEYTFPLDKLEGYWSLMRMQLLMAQKKLLEAVHEAEVLVRANPTSQYAAELLMKAAEAHKRLRNTARYTETLQRIVKEYPESALSLEAAKLLGTQK